MGVDLSIEHNGIGAVFTYYDVLSGAEVIATSATLYTPENLRTLHYQLADLRAVSRVELTTKDIQQLAEADRLAAREGNGFLIASVVEHDLQDSVSRFYRTYADDPAIEANIFKTMVAAREWIAEKLLQRGIDLNKLNNQALDSEIDTSV